MAATIIDIARKAGLGKSTVMRALRGEGYVSADAKARVLKAAAELDYQPNHIARDLRMGRTGFIAVVAWHMQSAVFQAALKSISKNIREAGYTMLFYASVSESPDGEREYVDELLSKRVAGAIISPVSLSPPRAIFQRLLDKGVKLVVVDKVVDGLEAPHVVIDHYKAGRLATEHLIQLGHRDIVFLAMPEDNYVGRLRAAGFRDAMREAGIPINEESVLQTGLHEEGGIAAVEELLKRKTLPTGLVIRHDTVAVGAMQAILDAGLSIPGDISIVGHSDIWPCHALRVPLTTVHAPLDPLFITAMDKLSRLLAGDQVEPTITTIDVTLAVRSSTGVPRNH